MKSEYSEKLIRQLQDDVTNATTAVARQRALSLLDEAKRRYGHPPVIDDQAEMINARMRNPLSAG